MMRRDSICRELAARQIAWIRWIAWSQNLGLAELVDLCGLPSELLGPGPPPLMAGRLLRRVAELTGARCPDVAGSAPPALIVWSDLCAHGPP